MTVQCHRGKPSTTTIEDEVGCAPDLAQDWLQPNNGKPREMHSLWSWNSTFARHDAPEEHADDVLLQTPLNSIYKQTIHSRAGLDPSGSFQIVIFCDSV